MAGSPARAAIRIVRPLNVALTFGSVLLGGWLATPSLPAPILLAALSAALIAAAGYVENDRLDLAVDRISHPDRPLPSGSLSVGAARVLFLSGYGAGLVVSLACPPPLPLLAAAVTLLLTAYNRLLKHYPLVGNLAVAAVGGAPFLYGGFAVGDPGPSALPAVLASTFHLAREILKDIQDRPGDAAVNGRTLPIVAGAGRARILFTILTATLIVAIPMPAFRSLAGPVYMVLGLILDALLIVTLCLVWQAPNEAALARPSRLLKAGMIVGLAAFLLDALAG